MPGAHENGRVEQPWILSSAAEAALAMARAATDRDPLRLGAALQRALGLDASQRAAVLTQLSLEDRATIRWHAPATDMRLTREGLEQATRPVLAEWRARQLADAGVRQAADLGCGLGLESRALARAGLRVRAVELDPDTAAFARHNSAGLDVTIHVGDLTEPAMLAWALDGADAAFLDPARRDPTGPRTIDGRTGHRVLDPESWSPPWSWVRTLADRLPRTVVKVAPGIDHALVPSDASATWAAVDGDLVEASVWFRGFAGLPARRALALTHDGSLDLLTSDASVDETVTGVRDHLIDVAPVVTRSGLVTTLAARLDATRIDPHIGYLTRDGAPVPTPFHTTYRVLDVLPFDRRRVGSALAGLGCGALTVMKRGFAADTEALRRQWLRGCHGDRAMVVALTRIGDVPTAVVCEP